MNILLENGFQKADSSNLPVVSTEMVYSYITKLAQSGKTEPKNKSSQHDYRIDFVQIRRKNFCMLKGRLYYPNSGDETKYKVVLLINEEAKEILSVNCEDCKQKVPCTHGVIFLFWAHRKSTDNESDEIKHFWSTDASELCENSKPLATKVKDLYISPNDKIDNEDNESVSEEQGQAFVDAILDQMAKCGDTENPIYRHCRPIVDEFEPVYIHHTMLDNAHNSVRDYKTFIFHMEDVGKRGLFEKIYDATIDRYKKSIWMEAQYCRIRCSLIERIANRKDGSEDEEILEAIFCTDREWNIEERQQLKEHKRFILKQTEKLENKEYKECGLFINEAYPYLCASPDGITDDHIVEIKAPKSDEEFEKYLLGKDTISPKYMAQIQIQMYLANVSKALYCVLSPTFETNGALHYVWVSADMQQIYSLISCAEDYWKDIVFPRIKQIYIEE